MLTTTQLKEYAQLSQAAYAYFDNSVIGRTAEKVVEKLMAIGKGDFTAKEAEEFTARYELLHQFEDAPDCNGFSATVFRDKSDNHIVLAFRGTEFDLDRWRDLLLTDMRIGQDGFASTQAIAEYRYIKELMTVPGDPVQYSAAEIERLKTIYFGTVNTTGLETSAWNALVSELLQDKGIDAGQPAGQPLITTGTKIDFVGHSLGGHLAMLADRFFPELNVQNIVTLNAPRFYDGAVSGSLSDFIYGGGGNDRICADNYAATTARRCAA